MNSIIGFSELALDDMDISKKTEEFLKNIYENSKWLLNIVDDILDISKIEAGKLELENIPFNMHEIFTACRIVIAPKADEKGILLHFYAEPSIGKVPLGDPTRLRQILLNILSNAVKFTSSGIVKIQSTIKNTSENTVTMYFEIKDSGIGMTDVEISRIFELFTQAESGTTRKYGGTGLGLAITKYLVEMMGGELHVESTPGVGSKFSFELTFDTINVEKDEQLESKIIFDDLKKPKFEGEILLCEDNLMNQQVICEHLSRVGLDAVIADNGKIGVDMVEGRIADNKKQFDLVFMDIHMPVMDGLEAAEIIHNIAPEIPIIALTANIMAHDRELYKSSKMDGYVGKPFTSQELWRCLMKYFTPIEWSVEDPEKQVQKDDELLLKLITSFVSRNKNKYSEIEKALEEDDIKLAHRLVHTLKSNAGQLKKKPLQQAAQVVEDALSDGKNLASPKEWSALKSELENVLEELIPIIETSVSQTEISETMEKEAAKELLLKLKPLLEDNNSECLDFVKDLEKIPGTKELIRQIEDFNFQKAAEILEELL